MSDELSRDTPSKTDGPHERGGGLVRSPSTRKISRRTIAVGLAWTGPAIVLAPTAQAATCSALASGSQTITATTDNFNGGPLMQQVVDLPTNLGSIEFTVTGAGGGGAGSGGYGATITG